MAHYRVHRALRTPLVARIKHWFVEHLLPDVRLESQPLQHHCSPPNESYAQDVIIVSDQED